MVDKAVQLFYSYAHEDEKLRRQLDGQLKVLVREGLIQPWYDHEIDAGTEREQEISMHLQAADIILLLISPDFIASDYCYSVEMKEALLRHKAGEARVVPIILRPCNWDSITSLRNLQALPRNMQPVTKWSDRDEALAEIAREIGGIAKDFSRHNDANASITDERVQSVEGKEPNSRSTFATTTSTHSAVSPNVAEPFRLTSLGLTISAIPRQLQRSIVYRTRLLSTAVTTLCIDVLANSLGIRIWGPSSLFDLIKLYPTLSIFLSSFFILIGIVVWILAGTPKQASSDQENGLTGNSALSHRLVISSILSTTSFFVCFILLAAIVLRPSWCPPTLCPPPQAILNPHGNSDGTLETYLTALQSATYAIPKDPAGYTLANLPNQIGALRIDQKTQSPYRVAFAIHSLQRGNYGMFIDSISLVIDDTPPSAHPLNVWYNSAPLEYRSNPFKVTYSGEPSGTILNSVYTFKPGAQAQLDPGETDEIDLDVVSRVLVDLRFHIQVSYRVMNQNEIHTLQVPGTFEVVFSDISNWHQYILADGRLVPQ